MKPDTAFSDHVVAFGRVLRRLGFDVGPAHVLDALEAVRAVGIRRRDDVYFALRATLVHRREDVDLFDQAFHLFWKAPSSLPEVMQWLLQNTHIPPDTRSQGYHRVQEALREQPAVNPPAGDDESERKVEIEELFTYSAVEVLRKKDFAAFSNEEIAAARRHMQQMAWPFAPYASRRFLPRIPGRRIDVRRTARAGLRSLGEITRIDTRGPRQKQRPVVMLCDISGSMERYARMLLHFMYALTEDRRRVESFVFGTRLTRITRHLMHRDVDEALDAVSNEVLDWAGGTRIGECIREFNYRWLRRVMRSSSVVLVISDGWDRGDTDLLGREMARLRRSCHRLIWLNPLMGFDGYEPLTKGMQASLPHVDRLMPVHNLESLEQLAGVLSRMSVK